MRWDHASGAEQPREWATGRAPLLGRDRDIDAAVRHLRDGAQVVSITGRSGVGKTRLAAEVARRSAEVFAGATAIVDVGALATPDDLLSAVAGALGVHVAPRGEAAQALRLHLAAQPVIVVADDVDRLDGAPEILHALAATIPTVHLLMTAQVPLGLPGEVSVRLRPLPVPALGGDPAAIASSPAVELYWARARAIDPDVELTDQNREQVAELCRRLDGLPLAIELAAARTRILSLERQIEVLDRGGALDLRPRSGSRRTTRHASLRSAIATTAALASTQERRLLRRLGAFEVDCPFEALGEVCSDPGESEGDVLDAVASLVELSLVEPVSAGGNVRYRLLPTIRDFAREELETAGETEQLAERHAAWYGAYAEGARGLNDRAQVHRLMLERHELRAALRRRVAGSDLVAALTLAADIAPLWEEYGYFAEERASMEDLLRRAGEAKLEHEAHVRALYWSVQLASWVRFDPDVRAVVAERLRLASSMARSVASVPVRLSGLRAEALAIFVTHDLAAASAAVAEGMALSAQVGDDAWLARFLYLAGMAAKEGGDVETAVSLGARSLELARRAHDVVPMIYAGILLHSLPPGTPGIPATLPSQESLLELAREHGDQEAELVCVAWRASFVAMQGDDVRAAELAAEGLALARRSGSWGMAGYCEFALAVVALSRGEWEQAARLHAMIEPVFEELRYGMIVTWRSDYLERIEQARQRLGEARFDALGADGSFLEPDARAQQAVEYASLVAGAAAPAAIRPVSRAVGVMTVDSLTPRELDVLRVLSTGATNREIGEALGLRTKTVMHYSMSIYAKLGVRGRAEATAWAHRNGVAGEPSLGSAD